MSKNIQIANVAERVIKKYKDDPFERVRVLYGMELRAFQWEWWFLMDQYPDVLANACMRVGKTVVIQLKNLDEKLLNPYDEEMIFTPKSDQAVNTFKTQYDIIEKVRLLMRSLNAIRSAKSNSVWDLWNFTIIVRPNVLGLHQILKVKTQQSSMLMSLMIFRRKL